MIQHRLTVNKDIIEPIPLIIPSGNVETHELVFDFSDDWDDLKKIAVFTRDGTIKEYTIDDTTRTVPGDMLAEPGTVTVGVYGYIVDGEKLVKRLSTNIINLVVIKGAYASADPGEDVPPSAYEQLSTKVDDHIADKDNPHKVTASQVGAYSKAETDTALAGKLDKVKSLVRVYPGVYATESTDGTPQLITATSDLSYIGTGGGYIPLYAPGGQLKTAEPTADDSAANKAYVDEKAKVSDVKVAGTSVVADGTANIPNVLALGDDGKLRVVNAPDKMKWTGPLGVDNTGLLTTAAPNNIVIDNRTASSIQFLNCAYLDYAVKAAMCDGKGEAWTSEEQAAARERMGTDKPYELIEEITLTKQTALLTRDKWPNGDAYNFSKVRVEVDSNTIKSGGFTVYVRYENDPVPHTWAVMTATEKAYFATFTGCVENGMLTETVVNVITKRENSGSLQQTGAHTQISAIRFVRLWITAASANNVGTKIRIYGVRA